MKLEASRSRFGVLMFLIDRDNRVESSEIIEPRVSRSLIPWTCTLRVSSIGIDPCVSIENVILAAALGVCLFDVRACLVCLCVIVFIGCCINHFGEMFNYDLR